MNPISTSHEDALARKLLKDELDRHSIHIHQPDDAPLFTKNPSSTMAPVHWKWADLLRLLKKIGDELTIDSGGHRRTLRLANPGLPYGTTPTFWCSIQYILPGEIAGAHRHTANAMRFIIQGKGAKSAVDGELYPFNEGDFVLTPTWCMHDHVHEGAEPMVWLDILDISLVRSLHACFFEAAEKKQQDISDQPLRTYQEYGSGLMHPVYPSETPRANPLLAYPAQMARDALERAATLKGNSFDDIALEYVNPKNGGPVTTTMSTRLIRLRPGFDGTTRRNTGSKVYHIAEGSCEIEVDGASYHCEKNDFISIPPWASHRMRNGTDSPVVLFEVNDIPVMKALGFYREENS
jgi:gentisate 1,2-dioxygenase